jgi:hypothetical protein
MRSAWLLVLLAATGYGQFQLVTRPVPPAEAVERGKAAVLLNFFDELRRRVPTGK